MTRSNLFKVSLVVSNIFLVVSCSKISDFLLNNPQLQYHMLAVGNGLSTIITNSQYKNRAIMFDTGIGGNPQDWWKNKYAKNNFVANYLKNLEINQLDAIFISHDHTDHTSNLETIVNTVNVKNIYGSRSFFERYQGKASKKWPKQWADLKIIVQDVKPSYNILGLSFDNLTYKIQDFINSNSSKDENNQSLVLSFVYQNQRFLLTGDTEKKVEQELLKKNLLSEVNFLQVAHHGSKTSSSLSFLNKIKPKTCFASGVNPDTYGLEYVGNKSHIYPTSEVMANLKNVGCDFSWTGKDGTLVYTVTNSKAQVQKLNYHIKNYT